jgi:hypothetical protein
VLILDGLGIDADATEQATGLPCPLMPKDFIAVYPNGTETKK